MFGGGRSRVKEPCLVIYTRRRRDGVVIVARNAGEADRLRDEVRRIMGTTATHVDLTEMGASGVRKLAEIPCGEIERLSIEYR
jgi:hypothetical protein